MPDWPHWIELSDLYATFEATGRDTDDGFDVLREGVVARLNNFADTCTLISDGHLSVLRMLAEYVAKTGNVAQYDEQFRYVTMWGDQDDVRVWINTDPFLAERAGR